MGTNRQVSAWRKAACGGEATGAGQHAWGQHASRSVGASQSVWGRVRPAAE